MIYKGMREIMRMKKNKMIICLCMLALNILMLVMFQDSYQKTIDLRYSLETDASNTIQLFYNDNDQFIEEKSFYKDNVEMATTEVLSYSLPKNSTYIRIDFSETVKSENELFNFELSKLNNRLNIDDQLVDNMIAHNCVITYDERFYIKTTGEDPYIVFSLDQGVIKSIIDGNTKISLIMIFSIIAIMDIMLLYLLKKWRKIPFIIDIIDNKKLLWSLSKNDFKTKYAGSIFGIFWAFVQPIVTIVVYWFVFQVGFRSAPIGDFPFVLWLIVGLVPWFFFQEALLSATTCLIEYSYLVKKIVFQIKILPVVKIVSALFVHLFFISFSLIVFALNGYYPSLYTLQIVYYLFACTVFLLGLSFGTSAIMVFFKDLSQIVQIILQVGVWMTPIMWNISMIPQNLVWIFKLNPMFYIVEGYRDCFINKVWFWEKMDLTVNFWFITIAVSALGIYIYKKLKCHFADML